MIGQEDEKGQLNALASFATSGISRLTELVRQQFSMLMFRYPNH